jgi:hypothetical protein
LNNTEFFDTTSNLIIALVKTVCCLHLNVWQGKTYKKGVLSKLAVKEWE